MKKMLALVLSMVIMLSFATVAFAAGFPDVDSNYAWAEEAINSLSEEGIITGYEDGTFKPGNSITRQEAITLFSKAMGAGEATNEAIVNLAYGLYEQEISGCEDSYAAKPGAYMIYRKILTADEVKNYLLQENRNIPLQRYEAAVLIAKALGADIWLAQNPDFTVSFADKDKIPESALGYVFYATELGIMNGMDENTFGPTQTVTRAQIAVMISRIAKTMEFDYESGMISAVNAPMDNVSIKTEAGELKTIGVGSSSAIYLDGEKVALSALSAGMECVFTFSKGMFYQLDAITYEGEETIYGAYRGKTTTNAGTTIKIEDLTTGTTTSYKLASNAAINVNNGTGTLADAALGDLATVEMSGGLVVALYIEPRFSKIDGVKIENIDTSALGVVITVSTKDGKTQSLELADNATISRNGKDTTFAALAIGDTAQLSLEYGQIVDVIASGKVKSTEGVIEEITISNSTSYITISQNGMDSKFPMSRDCKITLEGEAATAYDLRLGAYVKLSVSSETVVEIASEAVTQDLTVTGTIKTINNSYGLVVIACQGANGQEYDKQLFLKDTVKILDTKTGKLMTTKSLKVGNVITAAGTEKLGVYEVTSLMILQ
ncbi:MAG: S-layer homology domain-containing protein [Clostridia bacterium]|nr:S-layer homology domain-containing protein [Clostridia bacterium]